jgi:hypothetical protein
MMALLTKIILFCSLLSSVGRGHYKYGESPTPIYLVSVALRALPTLFFLCIRHGCRCNVAYENLGSPRKAVFYIFLPSLLL